MKYSKSDLIKYRLQRAKESFNDGQALAKRKSWNAVANRMYYSCFYIVSAYLAAKDLKATTHSGLKTTFNRELVKSGKISQDDGKLFNKLFGIRQEADYEDFVEIEADDIEPLIPMIAKLLKEVEQLIDLENEH